VSSRTLLVRNEADAIEGFMLHVLPKGFHRIRHYGLLASSRTKAATIVRARELIEQIAPVRASILMPTADDNAAAAATEAPNKTEHPCPSCGGRMLIIETFEAGSTPRYRASAPIVPARLDTS
jgi:hypothetical protein